MNVLAFIGHGIINELNEAIFLVNSKDNDSNMEIREINVDKLAKEFAEIENTMTIIFFVACRNRLKGKEEEKKVDKSSLEHINGQAVGPINKNPQQMRAATCSKGISIIIYSSELELQT